MTFHAQILRMLRPNELSSSLQVEMTRDKTEKARPADRIHLASTLLTLEMRFGQYLVPQGASGGHGAHMEGKGDTDRNVPVRGQRRKQEEVKSREGCRFHVSRPAKTEKLLIGFRDWRVCSRARDAQQRIKALAMKEVWKRNDNNSHNEDREYGVCRE